MHIREKISSYSDKIITCGILVFLFLYYSILLETPYYADDIYNSCIRGVLNERGINILQYIWQQNAGWMKQGRIYPFAMIQYVVFYCVNNIYLYKLYLVVFTIIVIYLLGMIVKKLSDSCYLKNAAIILAGVLMPVYSYDGTNPMNMFGGLVHLVLLFGFLAVLFEMYFFEQGKKHFLWMSAIFAVCSMITYEIGWVFPIVLCVLVFLHEKTDIRRAFKLWIPYFVTCGGFAVFTFVWKIFWHEQTYDGIAVKFDIKSIWDTFCIQFLGAVPFANWGKARKPEYLKTDVSYFFGQIDFLSVVIVIGLLACVIFNAMASEKKKINRNTYVACFCMGGILWGIPSLLIAISAKYQRDLAVTQLPYLPYFMEIFGLCLLVLLLFMVGRRNIVIASNLLLCVLIIIIPPFFRYAVSESNEANKLLYKEPRELLVDATKNGFFDNGKEKKLIVLDSRFVPCVSCNIFSTIDESLKTDYYLYQSKRWMKHAKRLDKSELNCGEDEVYLVKTFTTDTIDIVSSSHIQTIILNEEQEITGIYTDRVKLYIRILDDAAITTCSAVYYEDQTEQAIGFDLKDYMTNETKVGKEEQSDYIVTFDDHLFDYYRFIF